MNNINITNDNYKLYNNLYKIKNNSNRVNKIIVYDEKGKIIGKRLLLFDKIFSVLLPISLIAIFVPKLVIAVLTTLVLGIPATIGLLHYTSLATSKYLQKRNLKLFKNDYPNIDTNVSFNKLKRALERYERLSLESNKVEITNEERLAYLKQERDFLKQFKNNNIEEKPRQKIK